MSTDCDQLIRAVAAKAQALFDGKEMLCSDAVLSAINEGLDCGLDPETARGLAVACGNGLGGSGCLCGAVSGAVMGLSLVLSPSLPPGEVRRTAAELHNRFKELHGSTCCRVLTRKVKDDPARHMTHCSGLTRSGAELAVEAILARLPGVAARGDHKALARRRSFLGRLLRRLADRL